MTRGRWLAAVVALLGVGFVALAADEPTIKQIMSKVHKKGTGLMEAVGAELKKDSPDFDTLKTQSAELVTLGAALAKGKPKKGAADSWESLTTKYNDNVKALADAVGQKDAAAARKAAMAIGASCGACHKQHK